MRHLETLKQLRRGLFGNVSLGSQHEARCRAARHHCTDCAALHPHAHAPLSRQDGHPQIQKTRKQFTWRAQRWSMLSDASSDTTRILLTQGSHPGRHSPGGRRIQLQMAAPAAWGQAPSLHCQTALLLAQLHMWNLSSAAAEFPRGKGAARSCCFRTHKLPHSCMIIYKSQLGNWKRAGDIRCTSRTHPT